MSAARCVRCGAAADVCACCPKCKARDPQYVQCCHDGGCDNCGTENGVPCDCATERADGTEPIRCDWEGCDALAVTVTGGGAAAEFGHCAEHPSCACGALMLANPDARDWRDASIGFNPSECDCVDHGAAQCVSYCVLPVHEPGAGGYPFAWRMVSGWFDSGATDWVLA